MGTAIAADVSLLVVYAVGLLVAMLLLDIVVPLVVDVCLHAPSDAATLL